MGVRDEAAAAGSVGSYAIGRVESRLERLVRLVTGELVQANACPCKVRQFMLLKRVGQEYQPVWWEA